MGRNSKSRLAFKEALIQSAFPWWMLDNSYAPYVLHICSEILVFLCKEIQAIVQISVHSLLLVVSCL